MKNAIRFPHLLKCDLLADLPSTQCHELLNQCAVEIYDKPTQICTQGQHLSGMYIVAHGQVEVSHISADGQHTVLTHSQPGDLLGAIEAIAGKPCVSNCVTSAGAVLLFCPTPLVFENLKSSVFIRNVVTTFWGILEKDNHIRSNDKHHTVNQKIFGCLLRLSGAANPIKGSQAHLANIVGCSRQTLNKILGELRAENVIEMRRGMIHVLDVDHLRSLANS